jgi:type IV secretory pathway TraG/TraD family ATPase VirD4
MAWGALVDRLSDHSSWRGATLLVAGANALASTGLAVFAVSRQARATRLGALGVASDVGLFARQCPHHPGMTRCGHQTCSSRLLDSSRPGPDGGYQTAADRTRDSVFQTARTMTRALKDPDIARWITPPPAGEAMPALAPADVVDQAGTVYLLSRDGPDSAAPLVAALADQLLQAAITTATKQPTGRLDPPLVAVLDEAANIVPLSDLPDLYSHLGSRGIVPVGILQSWPQGERVWGREGMRALWGAATVKLVGAGLDDAQLLGDVSRLAGETPVEQVGWQRGHRQHSTSASTTWRPALPVDEIRALPDGHALLLTTRGQPTRIRLEPYWTRR